MVDKPSEDIEICYLGSAQVEVSFCIHHFPDIPVCRHLHLWISTFCGIQARRLTILLTEHVWKTALYSLFVALLIGTIKLTIKKFVKIYRCRITLAISKTGCCTISSESEKNLSAAILIPIRFKNDWGMLNKTGESHLLE